MARSATLLADFPSATWTSRFRAIPSSCKNNLNMPGAVVASADDDLKTLYLVLPGNVRAEISTARTERYEKTGKPPIVAPGTIIEDLRAGISPSTPWHCR